MPKWLPVDATKERKISQPDFFGSTQFHSDKPPSADGDLDLYLAKADQANKLFENNVGLTSPTLVVKPLTAVGAPSVFGSVTLSGVSGNVIALRTLDGGSGYGSQNG